MRLGKYSFGTGDRFSHEGEAQLGALVKASRELGVEFVPVWNKSNREHQIVGSEPSDTRLEADQAVRALGYKGCYFVDADHINMNNVDRFIPSSDFFTIDVADYIGKPADKAEAEAFVSGNERYVGELVIPGVDTPFNITGDFLREMADKYLFAVREAGRIYRHIAGKKGADSFVTEISMDEVETPQTPVELFFILSAAAAEKIPLQTIAPKFSGRFNKGVDYVGDLDRFAAEFENDLMVIDHAVREFGLPDNLKLSIHSGSDKFAIYPIMGNLIRRHDKGIHIKTAGTTWLEEFAGLAVAGDDALELVRNMSVNALGRIDELCAPYSSVIDIDPTKLPSADTLRKWSGMQFARALRHQQDDPEYNPGFRQLVHVSYKLAAECGTPFFDALERYSDKIGEQVAYNLFDRHICRLFPQKK